MIIKILIFLWIFILPVLSFIWGLFHRKMEMIPPLNKKGLKAFHKELFVFCFLIPIGALFFFSIVFIVENSFQDLIREISQVFENLVHFKTPLWQLCLWEILYLDFCIALMFSLKYRLTFKNFFNWHWMVEHWPMIEASLPCQKLWSLLHMLVVFLSVHHLGNAESKFVLFFYPITSYFSAKRVYTYYLFHKKGFCKLNREED